MEQPHVWAEIDLAAYVHNLNELRRIARPEARLMAVVKANAYGHGGLEMARAAVGAGADWLGVARPAEALALRADGIDAPILIFGRTPAARVEELAAGSLAQAVLSPEMARELSARAWAADVEVAAHVKVDSGMGRLGLPIEAPEARRAAVGEIVEIARLPGLRLEGLFTHFASADRTDLTDARRQLEIFLELDAELRRRGLEIPLRHTANSAALIGLPESHLELVRPGIATYGLYPSAEVDRGVVDLRPVMALKSRIIQLRQLPAGTAISYGGTYRLPGATRVATVAVGYADGLSRLLSNRGRMLVRGCAAPIVGRVCMDLTMLDVGAATDAEEGDTAVVFGRQQNAEIPVDEVAELAGTINYEITSTVTARVPRIYVS
jgi:alanine racemase